MSRLNIVILGLSITSSWGNGHATTYRALTRALTRRGHQVLFLERDVPWYASQRDLEQPPYCPTRLYGSLEELKDGYAIAVAEADLVIVGSYVPDGIAVGDWICDTATGISAFYDIDTPITLQGLEQGGCCYLSRDLIPRYDLFLSFTGGPLLRRIEWELGARMARALYCSVDPHLYAPLEGPHEPQYQLGYMGTYSPDRQPKLERLLLEPARLLPEARFIVAGPLYPPAIDWPPNCARIEHLPPDRHPGFYGDQRHTLNLTRADMAAVGYAPSVRLFEAAACGVAIISDAWPGLETFFEVGRELIVAACPSDVLHVLRELPEDHRARIGAAARERVLRQHTADHRAAELEHYVQECRQGGATHPINHSRETST